MLIIEIDTCNVSSKVPVVYWLVYHTSTVYHLI